MGWIGIDFDGVLSEKEKGEPFDLSKTGPPIPSMIKFCKLLVDEGYEVRIFTARYDDGEKCVPAIHKFLRENGLPELEVTNVKSHNMDYLFDDRCRQVIANKGLVVDHNGIHDPSKLFDWRYNG